MLDAGNTQFMENNQKVEQEAYSWMHLLYSIFEDS